MVGQIVAQPDHFAFRSPVIGSVWNLVKTYQVHSAFHGSKQPDQFFGMGFRVIQPFEDNVLETQPSLVGPVLLLEQGDEFPQAVAILSRHHFQPLLREGIVEADGKVAGAFFQETRQVLPYAYCGDSYPFGAPRQPIVCHEQAAGWLS